MNKLLKILSDEYDLKELLVKTFIDSDNKPVGYSCVAISEQGKVLSGGINRDKNIAIRIAIAECFERYLFKKEISLNQNTEEHLRLFPTTCGFAAGFDCDKTKLRAICEGLERWIWSKWIDEGYVIDMLEVPPSLSELSNFLIKNFDEVRYFSKNIKIKFDGINNFKIGIFIGIKGNGAFAGSRVSSIDEDIWEHSIVEAYRNLHNSKFTSNENNNKNFVLLRANYFSQNKNCALKQIPIDSVKKWPEPEIYICKEFATNIENIFLFRCLFKNFLGWHEGSIDRFVY